MKYSGFSDEVDFNVPDYKTVIIVSSNDQLNITLSKCGLAMLSNLGTVREPPKRFNSRIQAWASVTFCFSSRRLQKLPSRRPTPSRKTRLPLW